MSSLSTSRPKINNDTTLIKLIPHSLYYQHYTLYTVNIFQRNLGSFYGKVCTNYFNFWLIFFLSEPWWTRWQEIKVWQNKFTVWITWERKSSVIFNMDGFHFHMLAFSILTYKCFQKVSTILTYQYQFLLNYWSLTNKS